MKKIYFLIIALCFFVIGNAQNPTDVAYNFGYEPQDLTTKVSALQPDGKIIIGSVVNYNGSIENNIIRLNSDGTKDLTFNKGTGFDDYVNSIVVLANGKILIAGNFTLYNDVPVNKIVRLNNDGSLDTTFNVSTNFNYEINKIIVQPDNKIIVGGAFFQFSGDLNNGIVRLNEDGSKDTTFVTGSGFNGEVFSLALQNDGKIIIVGGFNSYNGLTHNRIVRLNSNGSVDSTFITGSGLTNRTYAISIQTNGKILVGGEFLAYNGASNTDFLIRLNADGSLDTTFVGANETNNTVRSIAIQTNGRILVGFDSNNIIRINPDGTKDLTFNTETEFNNSSIRVYSITLQTDNKIIVCGARGNPSILREGITRYNENGTRDTTFNSFIGFNKATKTIVIQPNGKKLVGGFFTSYQRVHAKGIIRLNLDNSIDLSFNSGNGFIYNSSLGGVNTIALQPDGKILVGGGFTSYNNLPSNNIIRLNADGTKDTSFNIGTGFNNEVNTIVLQPDGKILVGGKFTTYNGTYFINRLVRLNANGTIDSSFNIGMGLNNFVNSIILQPNGKILIGGDFRLYEEEVNFQIVYSTNIVRLNNDGTRDISFNPQDQTLVNVQTMALQTDGKILVGRRQGMFSDPVNYLSRLNTDGSVDTSFNTGLGFSDGIVYSSTGIYSITTQADNKIIVGGYFTKFNNITANKIIRLNFDGSKDTSFDIETGFKTDGTNDHETIINKIELDSDGKIFVCGRFTSYKNSYISANLITLNGNSTLSSDTFDIEDNISLWPNPTKDFLNIDVKEEIELKSINIYNILGQLVLVIPNTQDTKIVDVSSLTPGNYLIKINSNKGSMTSQFIKK